MIWRCRDWLFAWVAYWCCRWFHRRVVWYTIKPERDMESIGKIWLADCPFHICDHHGGVVMDWKLGGYYREYWLFFAFCNACNATGPIAKSPEEAAVAWNLSGGVRRDDEGG